jgi:hypothetical protein
MAALTHDDVVFLADRASLGPIYFVTKVALNSQTGRPMEVAYVGNRELFAKRNSFSSLFYLCNEHRALAPNDGEGPINR